MGAFLFVRLSVEAEGSQEQMSEEEEEKRGDGIFSHFLRGAGGRVRCGESLSEEETRKKEEEGRHRRRACLVESLP